jgi:hypothetical protein
MNLTSSQRRFLRRALRWAASRAVHPSRAARRGLPGALWGVEIETDCVTLPFGVGYYSRRDGRDTRGIWAAPRED